MANMRLCFTKKNMDASWIINYIIILTLNIVFDIKGIPTAEWPVFWCIILNTSMLYCLISIIGYYWQNHLFKTIFKHPFDLLLLVVLTAYFVVDQIISLFVNGKIPFIHLTF